MTTELILTTIGAIVTEYAGPALLILVVVGYFILAKPDHHNSAVQAWGMAPSGQPERSSKYHEFINSSEYQEKAKTKTDYQKAASGQLSGRLQNMKVHRIRKSNGNSPVYISHGKGLLVARK